MKGFQLEFFMGQNQRHGHQAMFEWLLQTARARQISGCTVIMCSMGFGHHRRIHSAHFFELSDQPVEVTMVVTEEEANSLFQFLEEEKVHLFYVKLPVEFGTLGAIAT